MPRDTRYGHFRHGEPGIRKYFKKQHTRRSRRYLKELLREEILDYQFGKELDRKELESYYFQMDSIPYHYDGSPFDHEDDLGETSTLREDEIDRELDREFDDEWNYHYRYGGKELDELDADMMFDL